MNKFPNKQVAVIVNSIYDIKQVADIVHNKLYEDISLVKSKLSHGAYNKTLGNNIPLVLGLIIGMCEVLAQEYFKNNGYEFITIQEFIDSIV